MDNTREKLNNWICEALESDECIGHCNHPPCWRVKLAVDTLIANGVTIQKWIPVTERLPENDYNKHWKERQYYLVRLKPSGLMRVAHYGYKEHDWWIDSHDCVLSKDRYKEVTHWMPLPEPPKED